MSVTSMGTQISVRLDDDLEEHLEQYCEQQYFEPTKSDVVRKALVEFLKSEQDSGNYTPDSEYEL
jgi:Arc/MetJ-type ribon-helix-helix transcriptional regulator